MFTICFDTFCCGWTPILINDEPASFETMAEAQAELDSDKEFYADCFVCRFNEIGHKAIFE